MKTPMKHTGIGYIVVFWLVSTAFNVMSLAATGDTSLFLSAVFGILCSLFFVAIDTWLYARKKGA
jgi:hypothetical protein